MKLVIVESPTKAKTISKFLKGEAYEITSSFGHIRDLPVSTMGVDIEHNFKPEYVIPEDKKGAVTKLKKQAAKAETVIFATDGDREGEAIAWHLWQILDGKKQTHERIVFHEITKAAIQHALESSRAIDSNLVDAQQARRVLDRLVGYELSPFLWKAVARGLSAGRVQSAAVRLIVEREDEIKAFKIDEYWTIEGEFLKTSDSQLFKAKLQAQAGKKLVKLAIGTKVEADKILTDLKNAKYSVAKVTKKQVSKKPLPPFMTSTLQQAANRRFGYSAKQTMFLAQKLYEGVEVAGHGSTGLITYMRTDSLNLSDNFLADTATYLKDQVGDEYVHAKRFYKTKSKGAQEAHEAIRPTHVDLDPAKVKSDLEPKMFKIYKLIWQRAVASQMPDAKLDATTIHIKAQGQAQAYEFKASGSVIKFDGFMKIYPTDTKEEILPELKMGEEVKAQKVDGIQHFTQPPARYTDASLVKKLEELGIGRPSTYAPIISTIQDRRYAVKEERNLKPTEMGEIVNKVLVKNFPEVVDYGFTAKVETDLDQIALGKLEWQGVIGNFYNPFKKHLEDTKKTVSKKDLEEKTDEVCEKCGKSMVIKVGRFGKFLACTGWPECKNTKPIENGENGTEEAIVEDLGECPECGKSLVSRRGRYGAFVGCSGYPDCKHIQKDKLKETGVKCPKCKEGDIVEKRTRRGKIFYACSRYPKCDQAYWNKPTGETCETCQALMTTTPKGQVKCSNPECPSQPKKKTKSKEDKED